MSEAICKLALPLHPSPCPFCHTEREAGRCRQGEEEVSEPGFLHRNVIECKHTFSTIRCKIHSEMSIYENRKELILRT